MDELRSELDSLWQQLSSLAVQQEELQERLAELEIRILALLREGGAADFLDYCRREDSEDFE
jgi:chaperonin cofactor prefoldin